jgi:hypothetical protein
MLALRWADHGGIESVDDKTLRNDFIDLTYSVAATYWDGLETLDQKAAEIFRETDFLANNFFPRCKATA